MHGKQMLRSKDTYEQLHGLIFSFEKFFKKEYTESEEFKSYKEKDSSRSGWGDEREEPDHDKYDAESSLELRSHESKLFSAFIHTCVVCLSYS
jgi:hypothetical protein